MKKRIEAIIISLSILLLASCSTIRQKVFEEKQLNTHVAFSKVFYLLPTENMVGKLDSDVIIQFNFLDGKYSFPVVLFADKEKIYAVRQDSAVSNEAFIYIDNRISSSIKFIKKIQVEDVIAYFQWCFYDINVIATAIEESDLHFTVEKKDDGLTEIRRIYNDKKCLVKIEKTADEIKLTHYSKNLSCVMKIQSMK